MHPPPTKSIKHPTTRNQLTGQLQQERPQRTTKYQQSIQRKTRETPKSSSYPGLETFSLGLSITGGSLFFYLESLGFLGSSSRIVVCIFQVHRQSCCAFTRSRINAFSPHLLHYPCFGLILHCRPSSARPWACFEACQFPGLRHLPQGCGP